MSHEQPPLARVARVPRDAPVGLVEGLSAELARHERALIVAGRSERDPDLGAALASFAERAAIPLLADPLSGARRGPAAIAHYDALLRSPDWPLTPSLVLRVGDLPTSKPLRTWLAGFLERWSGMGCARDDDAETSYGGGQAVHEALGGDLPV